MKQAGSLKVVLVANSKTKLVLSESSQYSECENQIRRQYHFEEESAPLTFGMPKRLSLDHDTVFFDNTSPSPFPIRLHLWLLGLGIEVVFTRAPPDRSCLDWADASDDDQPSPAGSDLAQPRPALG